MKNSNKPSSSDESLYFNIQADSRLTKHPGGLKAPRELVEACHINKDSFALVVGYGAGKTPKMIVEETGCRMIGVDLSAGMVEKAKEMAKACKPGSGFLRGSLPTRPTGNSPSKR
jgi:cyclopropane fatty-acyl-phospholipid synthase-like methyltransferase